MIKVLIVEDEKIIRKGLMYSFDWESLECIVVGEAENGFEALSKISELKPEIVILDINMPIINGIELLENIKHLECKIIIVSGHDEFEYAKKAIHYNVSEYLLKPVDPYELKSSVLKVKKELRKDLIYKNSIDKVHNIAILPEKYIDDYFLVELNKFMEKNYSFKILLDDVSEHLRVSNSYINARLKNSYNLTFNSYLNRYRVHKAILMMKKTNYAIYEISFKCGFSEYKYFSQVFKKYIGVSPTKLKNTLNLK